MLCVVRRVTVMRTVCGAQVVHISGTLSTAPSLRDFEYNIEIEAVRLKRRVQMFQWLEEEEL